MPEYLAPGVYVEEIDTGSKPIEGVSTSTVGMVGLTERGPVDVPILITSYGEFTRWFGGELPAEFGSHRFLPHAVDGFFTNGGKRLYLTRVVPRGAALPARGGLFRVDAVTPWQSTMLRAEAAGNSSVYVLEQPTAPSTVAPHELRVGDGSLAEYHNVTGSAAAAQHSSLSFPLSFAHAPGLPNSVVDFARTPTGAPFPLAAAVPAGAITITVTGAAGALAGQLIEIGGEHRFVGTATVAGAQTRLILNGGPLSLAHPQTESVVRLTSPPAPGQALTVAAVSGDALIFTAGLGANPLVAIGLAGDGRREVRRVGAFGTLELTRGAYAEYGAGSIVQQMVLADVVGTLMLTADTDAGSRVVVLNDRGTLHAGDILRVGTEYAEVVQLPGATGATPDPGSVVLSYALEQGYPSGMAVALQSIGVPAHPPSVAAITLAVGDVRLLVTDGLTYAIGEFIRINALDGTRYYHALAANFAAAAARLVNLGTPLATAHLAGAPVVQCLSLLDVEALDVGGWGNRLRISTAPEATGLVAPNTLATVTSATVITLTSPAGVEAGTVLEIADPATQLPIGDPVKVAAIAPNGQITLQGAGLTVQQQTLGLRVRSLEFRIEVRLLTRPDPAQPSRNDQELDREIFRYLSMDPRHSRYAERIIGLIGGPPRHSDHRPEGESQYVRVADAEASAANRITQIRPAPESLIDTLPSGQRRLARHPLLQGTDALAAMPNVAAEDVVYLGADAANPEQKTGLWTLTNLEDISIIAAPGRTSNTMQNELIAQCERMRYRVAVIDSPAPPGDTIADVQELRQRYDSKYAALYYPWVQIDDPFPANPAEINPLAVPPSGHIVGIYARTDIERGVHKAPANEVVRGVVGLRRLINQAEQEILNPYPSNINVIRDFRRQRRSIRVWGERILTSDPDWKYVNVRRLLIFIERSIDLGLQWVVFEPNAEPLWARVRRSISNFLTTVWRNGALEGATKEDAYFVKCDRTTMTQADIDNGRLICVIGVAPVKPAEFVIIRIGLWTAHAED